MLTLPHRPLRIAAAITLAAAIAVLIALVLWAILAAATGSEGSASRIDIAHLLRMTSIQAGLTTILSIAVGMAYHGGLLPYTATFFCFADYMRPAMRLAALNHLPVTFVFTHDSIGLGEDGPTHQPVEHLASLRCMPNMHVVRPADANETAEAWRFALGHKSGPVSLVLSRQNLPTFERGTLGAAAGRLAL